MPHDREARTHEQRPSYGFIKSQRRLQTRGERRKKTREGETEDRGTKKKPRERPQTRGNLEQTKRTGG